MRFTLHFEGQILSSNSKNASKRKHKLREQFHHQIKNVWEVPPLCFYTDSLNEDIPCYERITKEPSDGNCDFNLLPYLVTKRRDFSFTSIVHPSLAALAELSFRFYFPYNRPTPDVDNLVKTLLDALSVPKEEQIPKDWKPDDDHKPLHCLLFDDSRVIQIEARSEPYFQPIGEKHIRVAIGVAVKPKFGTIQNLFMAS